MILYRHNVYIYIFLYLWGEARGRVEPAKKSYRVRILQVKLLCPRAYQECIYVYIYIGILYFFNTLANMSAPAPSSSSPLVSDSPTFTHPSSHTLSRRSRQTNSSLFFLPPKHSASSSPFPSFSRLKSLDSLGPLFLSDSLSLSLSFSLTFSPSHVLSFSITSIRRSSPCAHTPPQLNRLNISHALAFPRSHVYKPTENHTGCHAIRRFQSITD